MKSINFSTILILIFGMGYGILCHSCKGSKKTQGTDEMQDINPVEIASQDEIQALYDAVKSKNTIKWREIE